MTGIQGLTSHDHWTTLAVIGIQGLTSHDLTSAAPRAPPLLSASQSLSESAWANGDSSSTVGTQQDQCHRAGQASFFHPGLSGHKSGWLLSSLCCCPGSLCPSLAQRLSWYHKASLLTLLACRQISGMWLSFPGYLSIFLNLTFIQMPNP